MNSLLILKKIFKKRFFVKFISIESNTHVQNPDHDLYRTYSVTFHKSTWNKSDSDNREYTIRHPNRLIRRLSGYGIKPYISTYNYSGGYSILIQYRIPKLLFKLSSNIITLTYLLYILYLILQ